MRLDFNQKLKLNEQDSIFPISTLTTPEMIIEISTKSYVDSLHENSRNRRDLLSVSNDQDNVFDNDKLTSLDSAVVNREPSSDNELSNKKHVDDSMGEGTLLRFYQTVENYFKVSVGSDTYNLTKYMEIQVIDTTEIKLPNMCSDLLKKWNNKFNNKNNDSKV